MSEQEGELSRRNFLRMVGVAGGSAAVHETLVALGLMRHPSAWAGPPKCKPGTGNGKTVGILGAGVGGLAAAYWLQQSGYHCTVLEAQERVGGRSYTARHGDTVVEESAEHGRVPQECKFQKDERLYVNLGPGRIPYHHRRVINLCEQLEVPLEVYVHTSDFNLHRMRGGRSPMDRAIERRRIAYDTQGYIAELLAKAINQDALDHELLGEDKEKLLRLLRKFGDLNSRYRYKGSTRAGRLATPVNVKSFNRSNALDALKPLGLDVLLESEFWDPCLVGSPTGGASCEPENFQHGFYQIKEDLWQTTSFQPVGGMDQIVKALETKLDAGSVQCDAQVMRIARIQVDGKEKIEVGYLQGRQKKTACFDFCISNIPFTVLKDIPASFSEEVRLAVQRREFSNACKVGWQADRRFWEKDHHIYGGISWIGHDITQMWYPSNDYFSEKGVLTGAYNYSKTAETFGKLSVQKRLDKAYEGGALLHPEAFDSRKKKPDVPKDLGISIAWQNVPFQKGCGAIWRSDDRQHELDYETLLVPDINEQFYFVGDQVSSLPGWQEGALMSAEYVVNQITTGSDRDLEQLRLEVKSAPMSSAVMG